MSKSGEAFAKLTYEEIRSMTLKEVGEWYEKYLRDFGASDDMIERNTVVQALKCGVMPK